jgi:hypothetical protein
MRKRWRGLVPKKARPIFRRDINQERPRETITLKQGDGIMIGFNLIVS